MRESSTSIVLFGARGRMGSRVHALAVADGRFEVRALVVRAGAGGAAAAPAGPDGVPERAPGAGGAGPQTAENALKTAVSCDVVIDFSAPAAAAESAALAESLGAALLVGTTGLTDANLAALRGASRRRAVLVAPNTSLGVCVAAALARNAARALGSDYECSIVEAHHARKKDAPSGTALRLARAVAESGHAVRADQIVSIRGGDVVGEHTVRFAGPGEYLEITHRATTRDLFARGALLCAAWLKGRAPGWYRVEDVVGMPA